MAIIDSRELESENILMMEARLPSSCYVYAECEETWVLHAHGAFGATLKFEFGRGFGPRGEWALSARCELPLTKSSDDYTVTAGCTHVFQ